MNENNNTKRILSGLISFLTIYFAGGNRLPNWLTAVLGVILLFCLFWEEKKWKPDFGFCLLVVTFVSYYVIVDGVRGLFYMILYLPLVFYLLAKYSVYGFQKKESWEYKNGVSVIFMTLILGFAIHGIFNAYMYYAGYVVPGTRRWSDFYTGEIVPGTQHTAYFLPVLAVVFPAVVYFKNERYKKYSWMKILCILLAIFFVYTSLATRSRMPLVIFAIVGLIQAVFFLVLEKERVSKLCRDKRFWTAILILCAAAVIGIFLVKDSAVVVAFMENMSKGGGILNNVRFQAQRQAVSQLFTYPMGGRQMDLGRTYCHNTWLDMANAGGLIPFFAFAVYTVYTLYELVRFVRKRELSGEIKIVAIGLYTAFFLYMSVEPLFDSPVHFLVPWIFVNGLIHGMLHGEKADF